MSSVKKVNTQPKKVRPLTVLKWLLMVGLMLVSLLYLLYEWQYAFFLRDRSLIPLWRDLTLYGHLIVTAPILFIPLFQFIKNIRLKHPNWHRWMGRVFLGCSILAAVTAMPLALTQEESGRGLPTFIFAALWLFFSVSAWHCARSHDFKNHVHFVLRSYVMALAFVVIRVLGEFQEVLLPFISSIEVRDVTRDWLCFVIPLLLIEMFCVWLPSLKNNKPGIHRPA